MSTPINDKLNLKKTFRKPQKSVQKILKDKIDDDIMSILVADFNKLTNAEKYRSLDIRMLFILNGVLGVFCVKELFEQLDSMEKYEDMLRIIYKYPDHMCKHFEETSNTYHYNFEHKCYGDLGKMISKSKKKWLGKLIMIVYCVDKKYQNGKLINILIKKMAERYNINIGEEFKNIKKYISN